MAAKVALDLPNSRTAEKEADQMGMELAVLAGFDPDAAVTLWQKMAAQGGANPPKFLSTHPAPGNREADSGRDDTGHAQTQPNRKTRCRASRADCALAGRADLFLSRDHAGKLNSIFQAGEPGYSRSAENLSRRFHPVKIGASGDPY